jgi:hypothetical protein
MNQRQMDEIKKTEKGGKKQDGGSGVPGTKFRNGTRSAEK